MADVEVKLSLPGINAMMRSPGMQAAVQRAGRAVAANAASMSGAPFGTRTHLASYVAIANVFPEDREGLRAVMERNVLEKAIDATGLRREK